ncbi:hypothetical protein C8J56DRAFT_773657 [Mycena floridula]|nr:hypothetical protein C8J56DRAFT_773657 [Mycena floridula]
MPHLRVLAGTSLETLTPITHVVNTNKPFRISSELFEGQIIAHIKGFTVDDRVLDSEYFHREDRQGTTWSIQVQGRFLQPCSADNIMFGNTFDRPLNLPWGSSVALKFMKYIDPTLDHDLTSTTKPWALSPLIATMPHFAHTRISSETDSSPVFPGTESLTDDTTQLHLALSSSSDSPHSSSSSLGSRNSGSSSNSSSSHRSFNKFKTSKSKRSLLEQAEFQFKSASQRRSYFSSAEARKGVVLGPEDVITTDFCYGFIQFSPKLELKLPGMAFDLQRYWDGQPVRFVCCERKSDGDQPWGKIFWCVIVELCEEDEPVACS